MVTEALSATPDVALGLRQRYNLLASSSAVIDFLFCFSAAMIGRIVRRNVRLKIRGNACDKLSTNVVADDERPKRRARDGVAQKEMAIYTIVFEVIKRRRRTYCGGVSRERAA